MQRDRAGSWLRVSMVCALGVFLLIWLSCARGPGDLQVYFLDVGQGDSCLIRTPSGRTVLIDAGPPAGESDAGKRVVLPAMRALGMRRIDVMVWTHPHADHIGGMRSVVRAVPVGLALDTSAGGEPPSPLYAELLAAVKERGVAYRQAKAGQTIDCGDGVALQVLAPIGGVADDLNDASVVIRVTYGKVAVMFQGDAGQRVEEALLERGTDVRADVVKLGHHGSKTASSPRWIAALHPSAAVVSAGRHNLFGHPHQQTLETLSRLGVRVYRTDEDGTILAESDGQRISVRAWKLSTF